MSALRRTDVRTWTLGQVDDTTGQRRRALSEELELGGDPGKNLEGLVAVFSPLIGALLSRLGGL